MAGQLNMNNISLGEHDGGGGYVRSAYKSVNARGSTRAPDLGLALVAIALCATHRRFLDVSPPMNGHFDGPRPGGGGWLGAPTFTPRGGKGFDRNRNAYGNSGQGGGQQVRSSGDGQWRYGQHIPGPPNPRVERELFVVPNHLNLQHSGINFGNWVRRLPGTERLSREKKNAMSPTEYHTKVLLRSIQGICPCLSRLFLPRY
ncbi:hypothetical protein E4T43_04742 [Aureobasidium subglaciale]|nr:hypothetical protein E4T43_04742 [Aureobasidium subglaciale]